MTDTSDRHWYFAYGSNMHPTTFAGRRGVIASRAHAARAPGWRLTLDKTPLMPIGESFANLIAEDGATTFGVVYEITADDLAHVDLTEGVLIDNYRRIEIAVEPLGGDGPARAFTLVSDKRSPELLPSEYYMALLIEGAGIHGLPPEWIAMLRAIPTCQSTAEVMATRKYLAEGLARLRKG